MEARKILIKDLRKSDNLKNCSDEKLEEIADYLYNLAELNYSIIKNIRLSEENLTNNTP